MSEKVFLQRITAELATLKRENRYYAPPLLTGAQGPRITIEGKSFINLASNNYLGFANDPQIVAAAKSALDQFGFGLGSGRLVSSMTVHEALEKRLARLKLRQAAIVFQTGYDTNLAALWTLADSEDVIISDELNHASIADGCRLSKAAKRIYRHRDLNSLEQQLHGSQGARTILVVTDGVFSMDGTIAPLPAIVGLAEKYGALVYVDDAHGDGVLGSRGSGIVEHFGLHGRVAFEMGTLSKAFAGVGGYIAADATVIDYLFQRCRPFMFSTGHLPPMVAAGLIAALDLLESQPIRLQQLWTNTHELRDGLRRLGYDTGPSVTPIVPVMVGDAARAAALRRELYEAGIYVQAFAFPVVPQGAARIRCIVTTAHSPDDLEIALAAFSQAGKRIGVI